MIMFIFKGVIITFHRAFFLGTLGQGIPRRLGGLFRVLSPHLAEGVAKLRRVPLVVVCSGGGRGGVVGLC